MKLSLLNEYMLPVKGLPLESQPGTVLPDEDDIADKQELPGVAPTNAINQVKDAVQQDSSNVLSIKRF